MRDAGNTLRTTAVCTKRDAGNVLRTIQLIKKRDDDNVLRTVFTALSAEASPAYVSKTQGSFGPGALTLTSNATTASVTGGTEPITHSWARASGSASITATSPASATTAFTASVGLGEELSAAFVDTITDANGASTSATVFVTLNHVDLH